MKINNSEVVAALTALTSLQSERLPVKAALKVRRLHKELTAAYEDIEAVRSQLIEQCAERDENGDPMMGDPVDGQPTVKIMESEREAFNTAWQELMNEEVEVETILGAEDFGNLEVALAHIMALGNLIQD